VKLIGDGTIVEFGSVVDAVNCALAVQRSGASLPDASAREPTIVLRIGINLGDVIIEHNDIYGDGVNIAARLEYSCSGSPDMFVNGKTAIDGVSTLGAGLAASACLAVTSERRFDCQRFRGRSRRRRPRRAQREARPALSVLTPQCMATYNVKTGAPKLEGWGMVAGLTDPSGVLWRFSQSAHERQTEASS
jgi:hypothetical protein